MLTMSTAIDDNKSFPRSHSSPSISDLVNFEYRRPATQRDDTLPRSASFSVLPILDGPYSEKDVRNVVAADLPDRSVDDPQTLKGQHGKSGGRRLSKELKEERPKERMGRRKSLVARPKSWIQKVKGSPERQNPSDSVNTTPSDAPPLPQISKAIRDGKTKTVTESFATFARKSWMSSSRSPSPNNRTAQKDADREANNEEGSMMAGSPLASPGVSRAPSAKFEKSSPTKTSDSPQKSNLLRTPTTLQKIKQRPQSVLMNFTSFTSANSSASSLPRSSLDNRSTPRTSMDKVPPVPKNPSTEKIHSIGIESPRRRDELWSAFRSLENDYSKFQAKSWSLKTNVVRSSLLPFLRNHAVHSSNKCLRPEDLDRRITILNKWWTGLLEVLDGRQNQTVSGVDRPILLEACYVIMTRPEWRLSPSLFAPLSERSTNQSNEHRQPPRQKSSASLNSSASQFMTESVYHNARNLFIQNLLTQMSFVVEKMALRHAPASLVTFCGKAAAYAFFFVPGIAEVLVRIWKLQADTLKRAADELGLPRRPNKPETDEVAAPFPEHIHNLGWSSVKAMATKLRQNPVLPIQVGKIPWFGPWTARWCGRDSDLFFVFTKHFHILAEEFLPSQLSLTGKARSPGKGNSH
jgi:hypothetical protein